MGRRVTLKDVARAAGVTTATVSYVINDKPGQTITKQTRERVLAAVAELHYVPNAHARTLRSQTSPCVGVVIRKNLAVPRFSQVVFGIQSRLAEAGLNVLLLGGQLTEPYAVPDYVAAALAKRIEGVIFIGEDNGGPDAEALAMVEREQIPFVAYDCDCASDAVSTIGLDYQGGARLLAERVLARGPRRLLYARPNIDTPQERLREEGVRRAAAEHPEVGLEVRVLPVTLDNIDDWDARYSIGDTAAGLALMEVFLDEVRAAQARLSEGDAVISSWAGWTHFFRREAGSRRLVSGELANNGENRLAADLYTVLPNFEAGVACADEVLALVAGSAPSARTLRLTQIVEAAL